MMVFNLWAMVITVHSLNSVRIVFWMRSSVSRSTAAVASSRTRILVFLRRALARQTNWRWPTLEAENKWYFNIKSKTEQLNMNQFHNTRGNCKFFIMPALFIPYLSGKMFCSTHLRFSPPSDISCSNPWARELTNVLRWARSSEVHTSASVWQSNGSRFSRIDPEKRTGS